MGPWQIVLIEDNPGDVLLIELALKENNLPCEMTKFTSGYDAVTTLCPSLDGGQNAFVPDGILLDLNTPKCDGFEVLLRLKQTPRLAHVPVTVLTSSQASNDQARAARLGAYQYIHKPSQLDEFLSTVATAVKEMVQD